MIRRPFYLLKEFLESEKAGGFILLFCTLVSLILSNSGFGSSYVQVWNKHIGTVSVTHIINDGLMAIFFLLLGLELKSEFLEGQFSNFKNALLPVFAAIGGMLVPAGIHLLFNYGTTTQSGAGIPMATDAAFALAILSVIGNRTPFALKMLLVAIAVIDDLCAVIVIAVFYTGGLSWLYLVLSLAVFGLLLLLKRFGIKQLPIYLLGGLAMWYLMLHSGVHATISGVLLAVAIPYTTGDQTSASHRLQHQLHKPVAFLILPLFALANTAIRIEGDVWQSLQSSNSLGILAGLLIGKPLGVFLFSFLAVKVGLGLLSPDLRWKHVVGVGILAGIGFTIAIFISMLAFGDEALIGQSKIAVLIASFITAVIAFVYLKAITKDAVVEENKLRG